mmetsp:Transcript_2324/g.5255  ORF Transcript_2324/g.5255 Transcript_2324/m.5255 type:complete len:228 (-) Transcript_2324:1227-1910(-)
MLFKLHQLPTLQSEARGLQLFKCIPQCRQLCFRPGPRLLGLNHLRLQRIHVLRLPVQLLLCLLQRHRQLVPLVQRLSHLVTQLCNALLLLCNHLLHLRHRGCRIPCALLSFRQLLLQLLEVHAQCLLLSSHLQSHPALLARQLCRILCLTLHCVQLILQAGDLNAVRAELQASLYQCCLGIRFLLLSRHELRFDVPKRDLRALLVLHRSFTEALQLCRHALLLFDRV